MQQFDPMAAPSPPKLINDPNPSKVIVEIINTASSPKVEDLSFFKRTEEESKYAELL